MPPTRYKQHIKGAWKAYREQVPKEQRAEYIEGITKEVETIVSTGVADYFLLDEEIVRRGKEMGGHVTDTGRGSAAGFFTNTLLGLSTLDRFKLPVKLYPERFVSAERLKTSLPDLDMNLSDQAPFAAAQAEILGEGHSYPMLAFGTLRAKSAFKMYARANQLDMAIQNKVSAQIENYENDLKYADDDERETIDIADYVESKYLRFVRESEVYRGIVVSKSQAPCGFLLYDGDIRREIGLMRITSKSTKKSVLCTVIDGYTADDFGYVKNDLLIVSVIKVNTETMRRAGLPHYTSSQIIELTKHDKATWDIFANGYTMGINQCERKATREKVMQYRPRCLEDLSAFVAAIRPGFRSQVNKFLSRAKFSYNIPSFDSLLKNDSTGSSWLLYQENLMTCLQVAGFSMEETYPIIKAISKKKVDVVASARDRFLRGFSDHIVQVEGVDKAKADEAAQTAWKVMEDSASYLFNASHAVAVAIDAIYGAYLKAHHPYEYYASLLSSVAAKGDKDRIAAIKSEMRQAFGIRIAACRFGQDNTDYSYDKEAGTISDALASVKGLSQKTAVALRSIADKTYETFVDLLYEMSNNPAFTTAKVETLIRMGYFDRFGRTKKLLGVFAAFHEGEICYKKTHIKSTQEKRLAFLREFERTLPDEDVTPVEQLSFEATAYYQPIVGHFITQIGDVFYDASGVAMCDCEKAFRWRGYDLVDKAHYDRIKRDCID